MNPATTKLKFGWYASMALTLLTIITFGFAMIAIPPAGPYCPADCMEYPYADLLNYYPRDYYWMYLAVFQLFAFIIFIVSIHNNAPAEKKIFSSSGVVFALISVIVLLADYFIQFAVVPVSVMKGETEGISLLTQYNGHGIFIALEELGYFTMSISLFFIAPVFPPVKGLNQSIRLVLLIPFVLNVLSFIFYSIRYGIDRSYRFEVASITIDWLFLIAAGILVAVWYKRIIRKSRRD